MTKFIIFVWMCSSVAQQCIPGVVTQKVFDNYKEWKVKGKRQGYYARTNFSFNNMKEILGNILDNSLPQFPKQVSLNLPKLKKAGKSSPSSNGLKLPKLKKIGENKTELPKLKLPKLKKV